MSPNFIDANIDVLHEKLGLERHEVLELFKGKEHVLSGEPKIFLHNLSLINRFVGVAKLKDFIMRNPSCLDNASTDLLDKYRHFFDKCDMTPLEFGYLMSDESNVIIRGVDEAGSRSDLLKERYGLSDYDCGRLFVNAPTAITMPFWLLEKKMDMAIAFGFTPKELTRASILTMDINTLSDRIKLAMLNGLTKKEFLRLENYHMSPHRVYARRRAMQNGEWEKGLSIYASSRFYLGIGRPIQDKYFEQKYPFDSAGRQILNLEFAQKFPEIQERLEICKEKEAEEVLDEESEGASDQENK